jgi:predicted AAA+ superfamily ATPase
VYSKERDYSAIVDALTPILHNLPGRIVAIDGLPGVGKTTLGRFLAYRCNVSLIETDLFLIERQGRMVYGNYEIARIIAKRVDAYSPRPVIVESAVVLRLLAELGRRPNFSIYISNQDAPESHGDILADLNAYELNFRPRENVKLAIEFQGCR